MRSHYLHAALIASVLITMTGCNSMSSMSSTTTTTMTTTPASVISQLSTMTTIGSTVDAGGSAGAPGVGDSNPYGLAIVPATVPSTVVNSNLTVNPGDLIVCNFNSSASSGTGMGTTVEDLKPTPGSMPVRLAQSATLQGCDALAVNPGGLYIWAAAYTANDNPVVTPTGAVSTGATSSYTWTQPWGQIFGSPTPPTGSTMKEPAAFYISNAMDGSIVQGLVSASPITYTKIITGFPVSVSATYGILAPAGLTYDPSSDTLYVVSSDTNSVLAFTSVSTFVAGGVNIAYSTGSSGGPYSTGMSGGYSFSGPNAANAKVIFSGTPLNYPISSALLYNGDLIVGNTGDNNMVEISPSAMSVVGTKIVDTNASGAIFGIATSGTSLATQKIYFNDDNTNSVMAISQ